MPVALHDLVHYCYDLLKPSCFSDGCTNGLQVQGKPYIQHLGCAVSATLDVIRRSCELQCDGLLVHHGLFRRSDSHDIVGIVKDKLKLLLLNDISLLAYHLPLDAHRTLGNNWLAARELGWSDLEPFPNNDPIPIGVKGHFPPIHRHNLQQKLEEYYNNRIDSVFGGEEYIQSGAIITGGAHKYLPQAAAEHLGCFITGTRDEPSWPQAFECGINFFSAGHYATEVIGPKALAHHLASHFGIAMTFIAETNPF